MASAQTGTGKTEGFTLPIIQRFLDQPKAQANRIKTLILTPTRELAAQIQEQIHNICRKYTYPFSSSIWWSEY